MYLPGSSAVSTPLSQQTFKDTQCHLARIHWKWSHKPDDTGARGPWRNQQFQKQRAIVFFNPRSVLWTSIVVKWPRNAMRTGSKKHFQSYLRGIVRPIISKTVFQQFPSSSIFRFRGQQPEQVLVDIVLPPYILICLAEQMWIGQAIDACLYTITAGKNKVEKPQE